MDHSYSEIKAIRKLEDLFNPPNKLYEVSTSTLTKQLPLLPTKT